MSCGSRIHRVALVITARQGSCGKVMFSQACVKNSVHGVMYPSMHWGKHPPDTHTPGQTPPPGRHPQGRQPLGRHPPEQTPPGRHLWEDTPLGRHPLDRHPPPLVKHPPGQTHPEADNPLGRHPPGQTPPPRRPLQRTIRILLECILI